MGDILLIHDGVYGCSVLAAYRPSAMSQVGRSLPEKVAISHPNKMASMMFREPPDSGKLLIFSAVGGTFLFAKI